jgi:hypothetical protein
MRFFVSAQNDKTKTGTTTKPRLVQRQNQDWYNDKTKAGMMTKPRLYLFPLIGGCRVATGGLRFFWPTDQPTPDQLTKRMFCHARTNPTNPIAKPNSTNTGFFIWYYDRKLLKCMHLSDTYEGDHSDSSVPLYGLQP